MNKTDELACQLNAMLLNSAECQAYQKSLQFLKDHPEIFELEKEIKELQKKILKMRTSPEADTAELMLIYQKKREQFENHPLVVNYLNDKENLNALARWVQDVIEGQLRD